jgi:hypothetical protein
MMDVDAAGFELATAAAFGVEGLRPFGFEPRSPMVPAIFPYVWEGRFAGEGLPLDGESGLYDFTFRLLVAPAEDKTARGRRNALVRSAVQNLKAGPWTVPVDVTVTAARILDDTVDYDGVEYIAAEIECQVFG